MWIILIFIYNSTSCPSARQNCTPGRSVVLSCRLQPSVFWECAPQELKTETELCMPKSWYPLGNALGIVPSAHNAGGNWGGAKLCGDPALLLLQSDTCQVCRTRVDYQAEVFYSLGLGSLARWLEFFLCNQNKPGKICTYFLTKAGDSFSEIQTVWAFIIH